MYKNIILVLTLNMGILYGQTFTIDSLKSQLCQASDSAVYASILCQIAFQKHRIDPDSCIYYSDKAIDLSSRIKNDSCYAKALYHKGIAYSVKGDYEKALPLTLKAIVIADSVGNKNLQQAINLSLGILYEYLGEIEKAKECHRQAIELAQEIGDRPGEATAYNNYAILLSIYDNDQEGALDYFKKSLDIRKELKIWNKIASSYNNIGETYMILGKNKQAIKYYSSALEIYKSQNDLYGIAENYKNMGKLEVAEKRYLPGINYVQKSIDYAHQLKLKNVLKEDYKLLSDIYSSQGDFKNAFLSHVEYSNIKDSIYNEKSAKLIADMEAKYETEKAQQALLIAQQDKKLDDLVISKQESELKQHKLLRNGLVIVILLILIILMLIFNQSIQRLIQKEQR